MKKILIVNPFGIGDVLFSLPLLSALKERYPQVSVSYLVNARVAPVLEPDPRIERVFVYERDDFVAAYKRSPRQGLQKWRALIDGVRSEKFDLAFDLSMGSPVGIALVLAGIKERVGYDYKGRGRWLTRKVSLKGYEGRHVVEYYLDLLENGNGSCSSQMDLFIPDEVEGWAQKQLEKESISRYFVIYPGGGASWGKNAFQKRWSREKYAELADKIIEKTGLPIILMGDHNESELCGALQKAIRGQVLSLAGQTSVLQAAAVVRKAEFALVNDGGPLHIAVASGARTVSIFGPVDPVVYGPFPRDKHKVIVKGLACQPCYRRFRMSSCQHLSCLADLNVEEVFKALKEYL